MKLIYMEITHNTDDSVTDLTSLGEGKEIKKRGGQWFLFLVLAGPYSWTLSASLLLKHNLRKFRSCICAGDTAISVRMCMMESMWVNSCPCADPAELQHYLSGSHWSIMLSDCPEKTH